MEDDVVDTTLLFITHGSMSVHSLHYLTQFYIGF